MRTSPAGDRAGLGERHLSFEVGGDGLTNRGVSAYLPLHVAPDLGLGPYPQRLVGGLLGEEHIPLGGAAMSISGLGLLVPSLLRGASHRSTSGRVLALGVLVAELAAVVPSVGEVVGALFLGAALRPLLGLALHDVLDPRREEALHLTLALSAHGVVADRSVAGSHGRG